MPVLRCTTAPGDGVDASRSSVRVSTSFTGRPATTLSALTSGLVSVILPPKPPPSSQPITRSFVSGHFSVRMIVSRTWNCP